MGALYLLRQIWPRRPFERISGASCGGWVSGRAAIMLIGRLCSPSANNDNNNNSD